MIEKKDEAQLSKIIKNINRGKILKIINKIIKANPNPNQKQISNITSNYNKNEKDENLLQKKRNPRSRLINNGKEINLKRKNSLHIRKQIIRKKNEFPNQRNDFLELAKICKIISEKCCNFYTISEFIEHKCDICNNKNGDSNEYIRWENKLQCLQHIFFITMEKKYLFKMNYSPQNIYVLKTRLFNIINLQKDINEKNNVRTVCKCCFLKMLDYHLVIKYVNALFMIEPKIEKNNINNTNKNDNSLSLKFQIIQIGKK